MPITYDDKELYIDRPEIPVNKKLTFEDANEIKAVVNTNETALNLKATIAPRIQSVVSSATVTPDADANDMVVITSQAAALTLANPTGTPSQGQGLIVRIKDNGTSRAITYGSEFRGIGVSLPALTVISKTLYLAFIRNSTDTKWDLVGVMLEV